MKFGGRFTTDARQIVIKTSGPAVLTMSVVHFNREQTNNNLFMTMTFILINNSKFDFRTLSKRNILFLTQKVPTL